MTRHNILSLDSVISTAELGRRPSSTPDLEKTPLDVGQLTQEVISRSIVEGVEQAIVGHSERFAEGDLSSHPA